MWDDEYGYDYPEEEPWVPVEELPAEEIPSWYQDDNGTIWDNGVPIGQDNGDGSWSDFTGNIYDDQDNWIGIEGPNGTWVDGLGTVYNADNEPIGDFGFAYDPESGLYFDAISRAWYAEDPQGDFHLVGENPEGLTFEEAAAAQGIMLGTDLETDPGFFEKVGNFLSKIFGGSSTGGQGGGGNFGGGGGSSSQQQQAAQQRAQTAQQQLAQAQQSGANAQQLAALQQKLALANAALAKVESGGTMKTILIAGGTALGVYALTQLFGNRPRTP
jgi:hypothetical protein